MKKNRVFSLAILTTISLGIIYTSTDNTVEKESSVRTGNMDMVSIPAMMENVLNQMDEDELMEIQIGEPMDKDNMVDARDFGLSSNADYYNPKDGNYYEDGAFSITAKDDTDAINEAIKHAKSENIDTVYIPEGNYLIAAEGEKTRYDFERALSGGIQMESGITLRMSSRTKLVTNTVESNGYSLITIDNKEDVRIIGGKIIGDKNTHPEDTHNYCHGITIANGSKNITIQNVDISRCEDDGIMIADYLPELSGGKRSSDIEIKNVRSHGNGRQGLTISTGSNIKVTDSEFSYQTKHSPKSGIDIEIESGGHLGVENIEITNNVFKGNGFSGVIFSDMFNDQPDSMSKNIEISENRIEGSQFGVIAPGKSDGLDISDNDIEVNYMVSGFSAGIGSTSTESRNVKIQNNNIVSDDTIDQYSIGVMVYSPNTEIVGNTLAGQRTGVILRGDGIELSDNKISRIIGSSIEVMGAGNTVEGNEVSISGERFALSEAEHSIITAHDAENLLIKDNYLHDTEGYGIKLSESVKNCEISENRMKNIGTDSKTERNAFFFIGKDNSGITIDKNTLERGDQPTLYLVLNYMVESQDSNYFTNNELEGFKSYGSGMGDDGGFSIEGNTGSLGD